MQPDRSHVSRRLTGKTPRLSITGTALLAALILALVTACGSGGPAPSSQIPATPPDVPSQSPSCSGSLPYAADIGSAAQGLISGCNDQSGAVLKITNISENVLDVTAASGTAILSLTTYDVPSDPLPTLAGELEVEAQNAVVAEAAPPAGAVLLAVGGTLTATAFSTPAEVYVGVDHTVSAESFLAAAWASYVMGINSDADPHDYYKAIADCVNSAYAYLQGLQDQPPQNAGQLLYELVDATTACSELQDKVKEYLESRNEQENVRDETQLAGDHSDESDWAQNYEQQEEIQHVIATDDR